MKDEITQERFADMSPERRLWVEKINIMLSDLTFGASNGVNTLKGIMKPTWKPSLTAKRNAIAAHFFFTQCPTFNGTCEDAGFEPDQVFAAAKRWVRRIEEYRGCKYEDLIKWEKVTFKLRVKKPRGKV